MTLVVATVNWRNYAGRGGEYVAKLYAGVARHLKTEWRGVCLTDDPASAPDGIEAKALPEGLDGWWNKLALFRDGTFEPGTRVLYFDLDTVIIGSLDDLASYRGRFAAMDDVGGGLGLASGIMAFEAGACERIWSRWELSGRPGHPKGDQGWVTFVERQADRLQRIYRDQLVSFKAHCLVKGAPPEGARVVYFHGKPRPHQVDMPWINEAWR